MTLNEIRAYTKRYASPSSRVKSRQLPVDQDDENSVEYHAARIAELEANIKKHRDAGDDFMVTPRILNALQRHKERHAALKGK